MKPLLYSICLFLFPSVQIFSQFKISGRISNLKGESVPFATVRFKADSFSVSTNYCIANKDGKYFIVIPNSTSHGLLEITSVGYATKTILITDTSKDIFLNIVLDALSTQLPELYVKSDNAIQISGDTITYRVENFKRGNENNLGNLLANMPGFKVEQNGKIYYNGLPIDNVLIQNDNLTGNNYELITKNLTLNGIDKIQVIKNYKDPENIISKLNNSSKQVLNIKFKNSFLEKVFGTLSANAGTPIKDYDFNAQTISLIRKLKIFSFQGMNTTGNMQNTNEGIGNYKEINSENNSFSEIELSKIDHIASIENITFPFDGLNIFNSNNTALSSINLFTRLNKKFSIKGTFNYLKDFFKENSNTDEQIYSPLQTITINESRNINKQKLLWDNLIFLNYMINPKSQLALLIQAENKNNHDQANGILQNNSYFEKSNNSSNQYAGKLIFNRLLDNYGSSAFILDAEYVHQKLPGFYHSTPFSNYDSFFFKAITINNIAQNEMQERFGESIYATLIKKYHKHHFNAILTGNNFTNRLSNSIGANNNTYLITPDSANNLVLHDHYFSLKGQDTWQLSKKFMLIVALNAQNIRNEIFVRSNKSKQSLNNFFILPSLSVEIKFSKADQLNLTWILQNKFPEINQLAPGFMINRLTAISNGLDSLKNKTFSSAQIFFSHIDVARKGLMFFSGFTFQRSPYLNIANQFPNQYYTYSKFISTNQSASVISFFSKLDKLIPEIHLRLSPEMYISAGQTYSVVSSEGFISNFLQFKAALEGSLNIKLIQIKAQAIYSATTLERIDNTLNAPQTFTSQLQNKLSVNWRINSCLFFDLNGSYNVIYPAGQKNESLLLADAELMYHPRNEKWKIGIKSKNIFNKTFFAQSLISPTSNNFTNYSILPRFVLASVQFSF